MIIAHKDKIVLIIKMSFYDEIDESFNITDTQNDFNYRESCNNDIEMIDKHIRELWDNIMVPYLENYSERQILSRLTINDYDKFYDYMINVCK